VATQDFKRKLAAILHADVKGYSRLMGEDEEATVSTLIAYREVMGVLIRKHRGRVVHGSGDSLLAEFVSVVDAVRCAVEIQNELKTRNAELSEDRKVEFRIGINLGDVIDKDEDLHGDGVNIAARIEGLAEGGGICISRTAFDQVRNKLKLGYEYIGEHSVKNIAQPVRVYRVLMEPEAVGKVIGEKRVEPRRGQRVALAVVIVLLLVVGGLLIWRTASPPVEVASVEKMAFPLPDKPSIAVLPFVNMSDDPKQEYFSDGLTDQIINGLSKTPYLFVIARNSTFTYKGKAVKVQKVAEDLGVKYVLEGSVQKTADRIRITAQLIDATTGHHLWSERYDRALEDIFAIQDDITMEIMKAMQIKLTRGEQARLWAKHETTNLSAYEKAQEGRAHMLRITKEDVVRGRQLFEEAIALDPKFASAYAFLGWAHFFDARFGWTESRGESIKMAFECAQKALEMDDTLDYARALLSAVYLVKRNHEKAIAEAEQALDLNPNGALVHNTMAGVLGCSGRWEESIIYGKKSIRLNPFPPPNSFHWLGRAYFMTEQYDEAIQTFKNALDVSPNYLPAHAFLAASYSSLGRETEAAAAADEVLRINPKFSLESYAKTLPYKNKADVERYVAALRKAGLPESPPLPLPDKPSIAVLPFVNMSDDPKQEYFSDGITDDLITDLSKISGLFVIARNSTFTYKGKPVKVQQVARDLGVRYVLEGSVRKAGEKVRLNAQLIDATTGHHLWAERYDGNLGDIFALQDRFTQKIVSALAVKLTADDESLFARKRTDNVEAYDAYLQGWEYFRKNTRDDLVKSVSSFKRAIELDPEYSEAHAALSGAYQHIVGKRWEVDLGWKDARSLGQKHLQIALKNPTPLALRMNSRTLLYYKRRHEEAIAEVERALTLDPNDADSHWSLARALSFSGRHAEAIKLYENAMRLNPYYPSWYPYFLGVAQYCMERYKEAATSQERAFRLDPNMSAWWLAAAYAQLGRDEKAADVLAKYIKKRGWHLPYVESTFRYWPFKNQRDLDRFGEGLVKTGLPRPINPVYRRKYSEAIAQAERALTVAPNDAKAHRMMAESLIFAGRSSEGLEFIKKAISLEPDDSWYLYTLGLGQFCLEQYEEALTSLEKFSNEHKAHSAGWLLAATYAHLGRQQKAEDALTKHMKSSGYKGQTVSRVLKFYLHAFKDPKDTERFAEGLRKAGLK
jgi:adenylate cyclase